MRRYRLATSILAVAWPAFACSNAGARALGPSAQHPSAAENGAGSPSARLAQGWRSLEASRYAEAEAHFRAAAQGPTAPEAWLGLGQTLLITGRRTEAIAAARTARATERTAAR